MSSVSVIAKGAPGLCGPAFSADERLLVCGAAAGAVFVEDSNSLVPFLSTGGAPAALAVDPSGGILVLDTAHAAVLLVKSGGVAAPVVSEYDGRALLGPTGGAFDGAGNLYFSDGGPAGESSLARPHGALYCVSAGGDGSRLLRPLTTALAAPAGVAVRPDGGALYVCETAANRLLRGTQRPAGVWHFAAWHTFAGRLGPVAVAVDAERDLVYVARPDVPGSKAGGALSVLSGATGELLKDVPLPAYADVSGVALAPDGSHLVLTDAASGTLLRMAL